MNSATGSYCSKTKMSDPIYKTSLKSSFNHIQNKSIDNDNSLRTRPSFFKDFHLALTNIFLLQWRQHTYIHHHKLFFFLQLFHSQFLHFIFLLHSCYFKFFILKLNSCHIMLLVYKTPFLNTSHFHLTYFSSFIHHDIQYVFYM